MSRTSALALATCAALAASLNAQQTAQPIYRVSSELVIVDLVATDRSGNNVSDLQPSDITVLQNGKAQKVEFVRLVKSGRDATRATLPAAASISAPSAPAPGTPPAPGPEASTPASDVRVAILLDLGSMPPDAFPQMPSSRWFATNCRRQPR